MAEKRPHKFFKRIETDEHLPLDRQPIPAPDDRYKQFLRTIRNREKYIRDLAGVFGFKQTYSDYSKVLAFSDERNQRAVGWTQLASSYEKPRYAREWLYLYAPIIFEYCAPRVICAMKDHAPPHLHYKTGIPVNKDLDHLRSFAMITNPERKNELNDRINTA